MNETNIFSPLDERAAVWLIDADLTSMNGSMLLFIKHQQIIIIIIEKLQKLFFKYFYIKSNMIYINIQKNVQK